MAYYSVSGFYFDDESGNVFIYIQKPVEVSYEHEYDSIATDIYEAQIFLDGASTLVGKFRPASLDGSIPGGTYGNNGSPDSTGVAPIENAPE